MCLVFPLQEQEMELESIGESIPILSSNSDNILTLTTTFLRNWFTVHLSEGFKACLEFLELISAKNTLQATKKLPM